MQQLIQALFQSTQTVIFLSITAAAFAFSAFSLFFGGGHDHDGDVGHDHGGGHDGANHEFSTVSFFSPKVLSIFALGFGAAGTIASVYGLGPVLSTGIGLLCGFVVGLAALYMLRLLYSQQANSLITNDSIVGKTGEVSSTIPPSGFGEISFIAQGQLMRRLARSADSKELAAGRRVTIISISGEAVLVEPVAQAQ